jgi:spermidine/putrescine transport system ATP-binding protein
MAAQAEDEGAGSTGEAGSAFAPASAASSIPAIQVRALTKVFGSGEESVRALDAVSVDIRQNEFFTLLGPSGCGKTTLLRLIAGFEQPSAGSISLLGAAIGHQPPHKRPVNTVFQSYALFPHMTVQDNIGFGLEMQDVPRGEIDSRVGEMLQLVQLTGLERRKPTQLSGGQQQRVALARALANRPKVLLLDEPLSALDLKLRKDMQIELKRIQHQTGITFIFVTHDQGEALTMSDRIAVMSDGRILQVGGPTAIYEHPTSHFVADFIGETNFLEGEIIASTPASVANGPVSGGSGEARVKLSSGAERRASLPAGAPDQGRVSLTVRPERIDFAADAGAAAIKGQVEEVVYFGTDTVYHLRLENGEAFKIRQQNRLGAGSAQFEAGAAVGVDIPDLSLQVLRD